MKKEQGSVLVFTLIVLVAMLFGTVALYKSMDTSANIASNLANKDISIKASDIAVEDARAFIEATASLDCAGATAVTALKDNRIGKTGNTVGQYYCVTRKTDSKGLVCKEDALNATACKEKVTESDLWLGFANSIEVAGASGTSRVNYVIDRMCKSGAPVSSNASLDCLTDQQTLSGSNKVGSDLDAGVITETSILYRVSIRVQNGSTVSFVQVMIPKLMS